MKNLFVFKRMTAALLAVVILVSLLPVLSFATETEVFTEDFSSDLSNWTEDVGTVNGGVYTLPGDTLNYVKDLQLEKVAISADVMIYNSEKANGFMGGTTAYVTARADKDAGTGYDFGIGVNSSGQTFVRLYRRDPNGVSKVLYQDTASIAGVGAIKTETIYNIKIATTGNLIIGLINDVQVIQIEDSTFQNGSVGVRALEGEAQFDNISVVELPDRKVDEIIIHTHSEEISKTGKVFFTATVDYNSVYGTLEIDQDTEGVTVSGLDCTTGDKTVTVKFQDGVATFPVKVVNSIPDKVIYETNFNTNDGTWKEATDFNNYSLTIGNGYAAAYAASNPKDVAVSDAITRPNEELEGVGNYYLEAKVKLMSDIPTVATRRAYASLVFASIVGGGKYYEMRLTSNGAINVYYDGVAKFSTTLKNTLGEDFEFGKLYTLKVIVYDQSACLYVNGKQVGVFSNFEGGAYDSYASVKVGNGTVLVDHYKTVEIEAKGDYAVSSLYLVTAIDGTAIGSKRLNTFDPKNFILMAKYIDGTLIPFPVKDEMISYYNPTGEYDQTIRISFAGKSCYVNYHYLPYLFYDNFDVFINPEWKIAVGDYVTHSVVNDRLRMEYNSNQELTSSTSFTCTDSEDWTDYSVSMDVFFDQRGNANAKMRYVNLNCRQVGSDYYQLRMTLDSGGTFELILAKFIDGQYTLVTSAKASTLSTALDVGQALGAGNMYNLRVDCIGNMIKAYFENRLMILYVDDTDEPYLKGGAGMSIINSNCILDNFIVKSKGASNITGFGLSNYPDGQIDLWQGNDIPVWENDLVINYADGEQEQIALTYEMIGPYVNTEVGKHSVDITYLGETFPIEVTINERPEYVADVKAQLEAFADTVDKSKKAAFLELKALYDSLSPYEANSLGADLTEKFKELLHSYDCLIAPELVGDPLLANELFNDDTEYQTWISPTVEPTNARWFLKNGVVYQAQLAYSMSGNGWKCPPVHGNITGISADILCTADMMHAGVGINVGKDGYYHVRLSSTTLDEFSKPVWEFQFLRKGGSGHVKMATIVLEAYGYEIGPGDWFNFTLTMEDQIVNAYLNGDLIFSHEETEEIFAVGEAGLRISTGDAICDNVRVYGVEVAREEKPVYIEPSYYTDDFEDETVGKNPSHWQEYRTGTQNPDLWRVYEKDGNKVYGTTADVLTGTWLHAFDNNPSYSVKIMAENISDSAHFGFINRMAPTTAYHIVGYDALLQKWYAVSQQSTAEGPEIYYQEDTFVLEAGRWYDVELSLTGEQQVLKIDGVEVFNLSEVYHVSHGRMGFFTNGADFFVDDYDLTMASGDIPQDGIFSYELVTGNYMEIEERPDGDLLGFAGTYVYRSDNKGETWVNETKNPMYSDIMLYGGYTTFLKMSNGEYLQIVQDGKNMTLARVSKDMDEWTNLNYVVPKDKWVDAMGRTAAIFHIGSATEVTLEDGTHRIFFPCAFRKYNNKSATIGHHTEIYYSDDFGRTWQCSETTTKDIHPGWTISNSTTWAESKVVSCADGTLRLYYPRNYLGCMQYSVSTDGGVTWGPIQQIPEIQMPMTSYAVYEDPSNPGTWYMVCCDQVTTSLGSIFPRDRFVLLRSTDGQNWEFLMNIERMFDYISVLNGERLYQLLDPGLYVDGDYVHITFGRSEYEYSATDAASHQSQRVMYMRVEKDKLSARPWDSSTIADMYYPVKIEFEESPQLVFGLNDLFVCEGTLKLTDFLGNVTYEDIRTGAKVYKEPDMFKLGTQTVELRYKNAYDLSYEIEIRPKSEIIWTIEGEGTVDPKNRYIIEGTTQTVNIIPADGWKLVEVWVGDEMVETPNNQLTLTYDKNGLDVWILFEEVSIFESPWFYVGVGGALVAAGAAVFFVLKAKKKKIAAPAQSPEA